MKTSFVTLIAVIIELVVYVIVYQIGYARGKNDSRDYKKFMEFEIGKVAYLTK